MIENEQMNGLRGRREAVPPQDLRTGRTSCATLNSAAAARAQQIADFFNVGAFANLRVRRRQ